MIYWLERVWYRLYWLDYLKIETEQIDKQCQNIKER